MSQVTSIFTQTASVTVASTDAETTLVGAGRGSVTLPANFFVVGKPITVRAAGYYSTTGSPTTRFKVKLGSTIILDTTANSLAAANASNLVWSLEARIVCRSVGAPGSVDGQGWVVAAQTHTTAALDDFAAVTSPVAVTTTGTLAVSVTVQWGTSSASNTITATNLSVTAW